MLVTGRRAWRAVMDVSPWRVVARGAGWMLMPVRVVRLLRFLGLLRFLWLLWLLWLLRLLGLLGLCLQMPEREARRRRLLLQMPERMSRGLRRLGGRRRQGRRSQGWCAAPRGRARGRFRCRLCRDCSGGLLGSCAGRRRRGGGGRHGRPARGRRDSRRWGGGGRGCDRSVVRLPAGGRRGDHDLLRRRRSGAGPDRREVRCARLEEQRHCGRTDEQRDHRRRHSSSGYPDCEPSPAFVGRHRPLLPFPGRTSASLRPRDTRKSSGRQPAEGADLRCFRLNH
jgi:hypothetical protein